MQNYAAATVEGFVTHDPVLKKTKTGKNLCSFAIAVNHFSRDEENPKVSFIDVETWEKLADVCSRNVSKGKRLIVMGRLRQDRWEGQDGKTRSKIKIVGSEVRFLESRKSGESEKAPLQEVAQ